MASSCCAVVYLQCFILDSIVDLFLVFCLSSLRQDCCFTSPFLFLFITVNLLWYLELLL